MSRIRIEIDLDDGSSYEVKKDSRFTELGSRGTEEALYQLAKGVEEVTAALTVNKSAR